MAEPSADPTQSADRSAGHLSDLEDRDELRSRYYGLLQELRVILPGVQVLMAFLLTVPFAARFDTLDDRERAAYGLALVLSVLATVCFVSPAAFHRAAGRTRRAARLVWSVRMTVTGLTLLAASVVAATYCVTSFVFGPGPATAIAAGVTASVLATWLVVPLAARRSDP